MQSLEVTEKMSADVAVSPSTRVSLQDIKDNIAGEYFVTGAVALGEGIPIIPVLETLTICILVTKNGFVVIGKAAPADATNFNAELGRNFAREDAMRQLWPLMGYELRQRLYENR